MPGSRRLSQRISEGDGISVIVDVTDAEGARSAEAQRAEAIAVRELPNGVREATSLPIFWRGAGDPEAARDWGADACLLSVASFDDDADELARRHRRSLDLGLDCVIQVCDEEELELALERIDPEIFLLTATEADGGDEAVDEVLDLLPDVPAGKLAVAFLAVATRDQVVALERAGVDAVLVGAGDVGELVGEMPPEV